MQVGEGDLTAEVEGEVVKDGKVLVIRAIRVGYRLSADAEQRETIERVHAFHAAFCPVAKTLEKAVEISTRLEVVAPG